MISCIDPQFTLNIQTILRSSIYQKATQFLSIEVFYSQ